MMRHDQTLPSYVPTGLVAALGAYLRPDDLAAPNPARNPGFGALHDETLLVIASFV
ncbi:MAG TPA: hypothetical protein VNH41_10200 [Steroidobacteraceae bacterium]|nr:hypothetical protein [Steroidobacteraceae bacterium]